MSEGILFCNAKFYTGRTETESFGYMLVENGRIKALSDKEPEKNEYKHRVDLAGVNAYPCMLDAHTHLMFSIIKAAKGFDLCEIKGKVVVPDTLKGAEKRLREFASSKRKNEIVMANNYIPSAIKELRLPSKEELDEWCGGRPTVVYSIDGHSCALSSAMLKKLGINPVGHNGILTGEAHERIQGKLTETVFTCVTPRVLARGTANVQNYCAACGISHVGALEGNSDSAKDLTTVMLVQLAKHMQLGVSVYFQYFDVKRAEKFRKYQRYPRLGGCGEWEADGAVGAHSAAFRVPYKDTGKTAPCYYSQEQLDSAVEKADRLGWQIACHAIGDCATQRVSKALANTRSGRLHRLEHGEFFNKDSFEYYKSGRFAVIMQPGYAWTDKHYLHSYEKYLSPEVIGELAFGSLVRAGVCVCGSSDSPVQSMNPFEQMLGMTDFYIPLESVSIYEAFRCYTINPARAIGEENNLGSLEPGKVADFFTSEKHLFSETADTIASFKPLKTYYAGKEYLQKKGTICELIGMMLTKSHKI